MKKTITIILTVFAASILLACGATTIPAAPTSAPVQVPLPTGTPAPTPTMAPTWTPVPTPTLGPAAFTIAVEAGANCRVGPSMNYPIIAGIENGQTVQILGKSTPEWDLWWFVSAYGQKCFVSSTLGTTSGNMDNIPFVNAPPLPPRYWNQVTLTLNNNTGNLICRIDFYSRHGELIKSFTWDKGDFGGDDSKDVRVPAGRYDIDVYNCKVPPQVRVSITERVDTRHAEIDIELP